MWSCRREGGALSWHCLQSQSPVCTDLNLVHVGPVLDLDVLDVVSGDLVLAQHLLRLLAEGAVALGNDQDLLGGDLAVRELLAGPHSARVSFQYWMTFLLRQATETTSSSPLQHFTPGPDSTQNNVTSRDLSGRAISLVVFFG